MSGLDAEKIKQALDDFENDKYTNSKEILTQEIKKNLNDHLKTKLNLQNSLDSEDD